MDFDEAVRYMGGLIRFGWKLGNDRIEALLHRLGDPHRRYAVVHVAGTKGKGSTTAVAASILGAHGFRVGAYFSPYVYDVCERVQINGEPIPHADFARLVTYVRPHIEALAETEHGQTTEFELKTVIGFLYFAECDVDFACIEVGIGGRMDATNVVSPVATVITNIGLDHTEILGDTYAKIAAEKAGIIKPGIPCVTATDDPEALETITRIATERSAPLMRVSRGAAARPTGDSAAVRWDVPVDDEEFGPVSIATPSSVVLNAQMRMGGRYQRANAACALAAVESALRARGAALDDGAVRAGMAQAALPGRLTVIRLEHGPLFVLDGAHNAMAAEALSRAIASLRKTHGIQTMRLVIGMVGGHSPDGVLAALAPGAELVVACQPQWKRAQPAEEIAATARAYCPNVEIVPDVFEAVRRALRDAPPSCMVLISGSFYTVGEVLPEKLIAWWKAIDR